MTRLWAAAEAQSLGYGGIAVVARATRITPCTIGIDHDTPIFAVTSVETWWLRVGTQRYRGARELFITADAGGRSGYRSRQEVRVAALC